MRRLLDFDRFQLSFLGSALGNWEYRIGVAVPPSFLPPSFVTPPEPIAPHVGVQMRNVVNIVEQDRNSDPEWMLGKAQEIAAHLGLDLLVYGHPGGCIIPAGHRTSWDAARPDGHMARELGYLKSCRIMLAPNSGWADLMAWLQIPALLEGAGKPETFEPLRDCFKPRLAVLDRAAPAGPQADALIAATGCVLPDAARRPWSIRACSPGSRDAAWARTRARRARFCGLSWSVARRVRRAREDARRTHGCRRPAVWPPVLIIATDRRSSSQPSSCRHRAKRIAPYAPTLARFVQT